MLFVSVSVPPLLMNEDVPEKVKTELDIFTGAVALTEPVPVMVKLIPEKLVADDCRFSVTLFIVVLSEVKLHDWQVKF